MMLHYLNMRPAILTCFSPIAWNSGESFGTETKSLNQRQLYWEQQLLSHSSPPSSMRSQFLSESLCLSLENMVLSRFFFFRSGVASAGLSPCLDSAPLVAVPEPEA